MGDRIDCINALDPDVKLYLGEIKNNARVWYVPECFDYQVRGKIFVEWEPAWFPQETESESLELAPVINFR
jgi:hypothetical protein